MSTPLIFKEPATLQAQIHQWKQEGLRIGFVPTMGNLHEGHLSLVRLAQSQTDRVVVSIFVNPLQFGPGEDFERYPRTFEADREKLAALGTDLILHPDADTLYPIWPPRTRLLADSQLASELEGAHRPGHFDGVVTVVAKLFHLVQPDLAVFGQKDYQQLRIIEQMVQELLYPIHILRAPIAREADGLAMSSRNQYLTAEQRKIAPHLYQTLKWARRQLLSGAEVETTCRQATQRLRQAGFDAVDYFTLRHHATLRPWQADMPLKDGILLTTARLGHTRLLDNLLMQEAP